MRTARVSAIATHLPERVLGNDELASLFPDWTADKILEKTGISERHISAPGETAADLAEKAARRLLSQRALDPATVDFLILCTQAPDYFLPASACLLQDKLGFSTRCGALDINQGCSGFVYGLALAKGLIETRCANRVLLLTADTYTKFIHPMDKSVRTLFGDGAAATLVDAVESETECIGPFAFGSDGSGAENLIVPSGGMRRPRGPDTAVESSDSSGNVRCQDNLYMNGPAIMSFTLEVVPKAVAELIGKANIQMDAFDYVVFHQANGFMLEALRKRIKIPREKFVVDLKRYGNTVSSTIPLALEPILGAEGGEGKKTAMLVGFGVGYSWGATVVRF